MPKISDLVDIGTNVGPDDLYVVVDVSDAATPDKSIKHKNIFLLPSGAINAPSLRFSDDQDVGIYRPAANNLSVVANEAEIVRVKPSGVGINTSQIDTSLHVKGPNTTNRGQIYLQSDATNVDPRLIFADSANTRYLSIYGDTSAAEVVTNTGPGLSYSLRINGSESFNVDPSGTFNVNGATSQAFSVNNLAPSDSLIVNVSGCLMGTNTSRGDNAQLQVVDDIEVFKAGAANAAPEIKLSKTRGSLSSPTEVNNNDSLGYVIFRGYDGVDYVDSAVITAEADGDWTTGGDTTDNPSRMVFRTTPEGETTPVDRMVIKKNGEIGVGTGNPVSLLHLDTDVDNVLHLSNSSLTENRTRITAATISGSVDIRAQDLGTFIVKTGGDALSKGTNSVEGLRVTEDQVFCYNQPTPVAVSGGTLNLTAENLKQKIIISYDTGSPVYTLPSGVELDEAFASPYTNMAFTFSVISTQSVFILISGNTNNSVIGNDTVLSSATFVVRRSGNNTYETYRVT